MVREAIERHLPRRPSAVSGLAGSRERAPAASTGVSGPRLDVTSGALPHASHAMFVFAAEPDGDGRCIIEPVVACTHCGYCKSLGH